MPRKSEPYDTDENDGLKRDLVGQWCLEKHERLRKYVGAASGARSHWPYSSYVDLYCGTGRARIEATSQVIDGSPLVAAMEARKRVPFTEIHIGDLDQCNVDACATRLCAEGFDNVFKYQGHVSDTVKEVIPRLQRGLHLAFLDPYNLGLPFAAIEELASVKHLDLLMHVSELDMQRNAIGNRSHEKLDLFAPGWRDEVDVKQRGDIVKQQVFNYWLRKLTALGFKMRSKVERVTGMRNQPLYWLVLATRADIGDALWAKIANATPQGRLDF